jgi:CRP-like cAMP-binding protein
LPTITQAAARNRLLALMSPDDFAHLAPHLEPVQYARGIVLAVPDQSIRDVVFLERGVGSIVAVSPEGNEVEAGMFGREGMGPVDPIVGSDRTPHKILIQVADEGWRVEREVFSHVLEDRPTLRLFLMRWVQALAAQTSFTALSNAVHPIEERLARWLLMCDDRIDTGDMMLTHEFISIMLAVRRPSITTALHVLEGNGFVRTERGCIIVRNRRALEEFARDAYGKPESEYRRLIGPMR